MDTLYRPADAAVRRGLVGAAALPRPVRAWSSRPTSGAAWALSIVGLVIVIRILLIPLFVKQIKAQRGLQMLQPQMKEIQKKYKDDRQKQSEEMMKLYKETGTNPLSSCLPILVQAPFFFALFHVLNEVAKGQTVGVMTQAEVDVDAERDDLRCAAVRDASPRADDASTSRSCAGIDDRRDDRDDVHHPAPADGDATCRPARTTRWRSSRRSCSTSSR